MAPRGSHPPKLPLITNPAASGLLLRHVLCISFVAWRCFFFALLSYTLTPVSLVSSIDLDPTAVFLPVAFFFYTSINYIFIHIWFLVCCVALFLLHFVIVYFDARIKLWLLRSTLIQQQYLCQWLTSSTWLILNVNLYLASYFRSYLVSPSWQGHSKYCISERPGASHRASATAWPRGRNVFLTPATRLHSLSFRPS